MRSHDEIAADEGWGDAFLNWTAANEIARSAYTESMSRMRYGTHRTSHSVSSPDNVNPGGYIALTIYWRPAGAVVTCALKNAKPDRHLDVHGRATCSFRGVSGEDQVKRVASAVRRAVKESVERARQRFTAHIRRAEREQERQREQEARQQEAEQP